MPDQPVHLLAALRDVPPLEGAVCRQIGAPMWDGELAGEDPAERRDRHAAAARICRTCPARWPCAALAELYERDGPPLDGVWAARVREPRIRGAA